MIEEKILQRIEQVKGQLEKVNPDYKITIHSMEFYSKGYRFAEREFILSLCCDLETQNSSFLEGMLDYLKREKNRQSNSLENKESRG